MDPVYQPSAVLSLKPSYRLGFRHGGELDTTNLR